MKSELQCVRLKKWYDTNTTDLPRTSSPLPYRLEYHDLLRSYIILQSSRY